MPCSNMVAGWRLHMLILTNAVQVGERKLLAKSTNKAESR
jgi:hypothetical protein